MNKFFYPRLALVNLKKNGNTYIPYILTCIGSIIAFYTMVSIHSNKGLDQMPGSANLKIILFLGIIVIGIFAVIFLFYTNSFLIKRRKKELGLYSILGLEKKHIARVLFYETVFVTVISLSLGLIGGILIGKLLFLLLLNIVHFKSPLIFHIDYWGLLITTGVFLVIFGLTLLTNFLQVKLSNPIDLLKGGQHGEKEPKSSWIVTVIGLISLGAGYGIALSVKTPLEALMLFFVAVVFVIIGTYALFISGSITLLKQLKKNKRFYYQSRNFISVSGMIYRMKQNAVGLANICILSTMVLVTLSTTVSLYVGQEGMRRDFYPMDVSIIGEINNTDFAEVKAIVESEKEKLKIRSSDEISYDLARFRAFQEGSHFLKDMVEDESTDARYYERISNMILIPLDDYNRMTGEQKSLAENEMLIFSVGDNYGEATIVFGDQQYLITEQLEAIPMDFKKTQDMGQTYYLVVKDDAVMEGVYQTMKNDDDPQTTLHALMFNLDGDEDTLNTFSANLRTAITQSNPDIDIQNLYEALTELYFFFGGFLFLGVFLGSLFMMATVLIIYFKQISEGYEDSERFEIMEKVGMDKTEVKKTIGKQILMVFFLPLAGAIVHVAFAFPVITKMLAAFRLTNITLIFLCTLAGVLVYALVYTGVYLLTARSYYKMIH
ncbi:FtsX-like permease family protein [Acetobacterium wieringae]|uniref:FtsX-like permease family protein n=1 Tax=Acetobacterium wieringae TaxID=52694 RepID=UPI0026EB7864|nr:FtsX-like permease family protein [Acetobacterium wieringae]